MQPFVSKSAWLLCSLALVFASPTHADNAAQNEETHKPFEDSCEGLPQTLVLSLKKADGVGLRTHARQTQQVMTFVKAGIRSSNALSAQLSEPIAHNWDGSIVYLVSDVEQLGISSNGDDVGLDELRDKILEVSTARASASAAQAPAQSARLQVEKGKCVKAQEFRTTEYIGQIRALSNAPQYWSYESPEVHNGAANILEAQKITKGSGVTVGIVDTGLLREHPNLVRTEGGYDFISHPGTANDGDGRDADYADVGDLASPNRSSWHGSHVQGTMNGNSTPEFPDFFGVAPETQAVVARALGLQGRGTIGDIENAIMWLGGWDLFPPESGVIPRQKVDVINLSLGAFGECVDSFNEWIFDELYANNVLVIAAAGNDKRSASSSPGNCKKVISVAATGSSGHLASFSNYGIAVDVAAPGVNIFAPDNDSLDGVDSSNIIDSKSGTSMASPHVAGVAALLISYARSQDRELTVDELTRYLTSQNTTRPYPGGCVINPDCTGGLLDAKLALKALIADMDGKPPLLATQGCLTEWQIIRNMLGMERANALIPGGDAASCTVTSSVVAGAGIIEAVESVPQMAGAASFTSSAD